MADPRSGIKASSKAISATDRQARAVELRKQGCSFQQIADMLGYAGHQGAQKAVLAALKKTLQEPTDELRKLECERLDVMLQSLWPSIVAKNQFTPRAVEVALKIMDRRAAYIGLDAPKQIEDHQTLTIKVMAEQMGHELGLDPVELVAEAEAIIVKAREEAASI